MPKASLHVTEQMLALRGAPTLRPLRRQHGGERHFAVDRLLKNILHSRPDFRSVAINDPALLSFLERAARHDLEQRAAFRARVIKHLGADGVSFAEVGE